MRQRKHIAAVIALVLLIFIVLPSIWTSRAGAEPVTSELPENHPELDNPTSQKALAEVEPFPSPEQDTCQHCHLPGEITGMWTPLFRWILFGAMGLVFV